MFARYGGAMEHDAAPKRIEDFAIEMDVPLARRPASGLRYLVWGAITFCALFIGLVLAANPMVQEQVARLTDTLPTKPEPTTAQNVAVDPTPLAATADPVDGKEVLLAPVRAATAFTALSRSAQSAFGLGGSTADGALADVEIEYVFPDADQESATAPRAASDRTRPVVSNMPQNRVPVRRGGIAIGE